MTLPDGSLQSLASVWKVEDRFLTTSQDEANQSPDKKNTKSSADYSHGQGIKVPQGSILASPPEDVEPKPLSSPSSLRLPVSRLLSHSADKPLSVNFPDGGLGHGPSSQGGASHVKGTHESERRPHSAAAVLSRPRRSPGSLRYPVAPVSLWELYEGSSRRPESARPPVSPKAATHLALSADASRSYRPLSAREALMQEKSQRAHPRQKWPPEGSGGQIGGIKSSEAIHAEGDDDPAELGLEDSGEPSASSSSSPLLRRDQLFIGKTFGDPIVKDRHAAAIIRPNSALPVSPLKSQAMIWESGQMPTQSDMIMSATVERGKNGRPESPHSGLFKSRLHKT